MKYTWILIFYTYIFGGCSFLMWIVITRLIEGLEPQTAFGAYAVLVATVCIMATHIHSAYGWYKKWKERRIYEPKTDIKEAVVRRVQTLRVAPKPKPAPVPESVTLLEKLSKSECPDCGHSGDFLIGPSGGMCQNVQCPECKARFNYSPLFAERI